MQVDLNHEEKELLDYIRNKNLDFNKIRYLLIKADTEKGFDTFAALIDSYLK